MIEAIRNGWYALPNGDHIRFLYDPDGKGSGTITIEMGTRHWVVREFRREGDRGSLRIKMEREEPK